MKRLVTLSLLLLGLAARADSVTQFYPKLGSVPFLTGTSNFVSGSAVSNFNAQVITSTIYTNPAITLSNGTPVTISGYVTNYTTNIAGLFDLSRYDDVDVCVRFTGAAAGVVSNAVTFTFYKTIDGTTNNAWPAFTLTPSTASGANGASYPLGTNYHLGAGYGLILWSVSNAGTNYATNLLAVVAGKSIRSGP